MPDDIVDGNRIVRLIASEYRERPGEVVLELFKTEPVPDGYPVTEPDWSTVKHYAALPCVEVGLFETFGAAQAWVSVPRAMWEDCVRRWHREEGQHVS